jgi:broad specificity phosphatase PhoE
MILLRHGESEFNRHFTPTRRDPGIVDPPLTALGRAQAERAAAALASAGLRRIVVSPYRRALATAAPLARRLGLPLTVNPLVRERYAFVCDVGSPRSELERAWPEVDFSRLDEVWWPAAEEPAAGLADRAALFRAEMAALPDWRWTLVVSHWGFIHAMIGEHIGNGEWRHCDLTAG